MILYPNFRSGFINDLGGDSDVGDIVMLVTLWLWLIWDVGGRIIMLVIFSMY